MRSASIVHSIEVRPAISVAKWTAFAAIICSLFISAILLGAQNKPAQNNPAKTTPAASPAAKSEAKAIYESVCASCHGLDAGGSERGPNIRSRQETVQKTDAQLLAILNTGKVSSGMPSFSAFGPAKLAALVSYLRTLQGRTGETLLPGDPVKGKALFYGQAKCADCHMVNGRGGFFGPDLTYYASTLDAQGVRTKITNPDKDLDPRRGTVNVTLADSSSISGLPRNEDNFSLQLQTLDGTFHLLSKSDIRNQTYTGSSGMPANYSSTLSASELNDLVSYLLSVSGSRNLPKTVKPSEDEDDE